MSKMILVCGKSGSGKTTFIKKMKEKPEYKDWQVISVDDIYKDYDSDRKNKFHVWIRFFQEINTAMEENINVILETSALKRHDRSQFVSWFPGFSNHYMIWISTESEQMRFNNNQYRDRVIPTEIMREQNIIAQSPTVSEMVDDNWDTICVVKNIQNTFKIEDSGIKFNKWKGLF